MNRVSRPAIPVTSKDFFQDCASRVKYVAKRIRLQGVVNDVGLAIDDYCDRAVSGQLFQISSVVTKCCGIDKKDFQTLYSSFLVANGSIGRDYYDIIRNSARLSICPFCSTRQTAAVDHFLPKNHFPQFSVAFENLVPICTDCNSEKLDTFPRGAEEVLFHPYFESALGHDWLGASVMWEPGVRLEFSVSSKCSIDASTRRRIQNQFNLLKLDRLFAFRAAVELESQREHFDAVRDHGGATALQSHLNDLADSASSREHSPWKTAMYRALADDTDFIDHGEP